MRKTTTTLLLASTLVAGATAAPLLYAQGSQQPSGSMMGHGMMGDKNTNDRGMMGMMKQMSEMIGSLQRHDERSPPERSVAKDCAVHAGQERLNAGRTIC